MAEVYSKGDRHFLGHFPTAGEAADAYAKARADLPTGRGGDDSFVRVFQSFLDDCDKDANGKPKVGEFMTYKEQDFTFEGVVFRIMKGRKRPFFEWVSACSVCHAPYDTLTATTPGVAKGITRNCETHRKGAKAAKPDTTPRPPVSNLVPGDVPQEWIDRTLAAAEALSLIDDAIDPFALLKECWPDKSQPEGFMVFVAKSPKSPVFMKAGKLFLRNT